MFDIKDGRH